MAGAEILSGLKSPYLQFVPLHGFARYNLCQLVTEGVVPDDSDYPMPVCILLRIAGPLHEFQKVKQVRSLQLILRRGFLRVDTSEGKRRCPGQQQDSANESWADPLGPALGRFEFRIAVKGRRRRDLYVKCP